MAEDNLRLPTKAFLDRKTAPIDGLLNHKWTNQEISQKQKRLGVLENKFAPLKRIELNRKRDQALRDGDEAEIARIDTELARLANAKTRYALGQSVINGVIQTPDTANYKYNAAHKQRMANLARVNEEHKRKDEQNYVKALAIERQKKVEEEAARERGEMHKVDPLRRRDTKMKYRFDVDEGGNVMLGGKAAPRSNEGSRATTPAVGEKNDKPKWMQKKSNRISMKNGGEDEMIRQMDIEIDVVI